MSSNKSEPLQLGQVGIVFLLSGDRLFIEASQLSEAESCAGWVNHRRGHEKLWADLQTQGLAPRDEDYITVPRGRVIFSAQAGQYMLLLDRCILRQSKLVQEIRKRMNLPRRGVLVSTDDHYRCAFCMSKTSF